MTSKVKYELLSPALVVQIKANAAYLPPARWAVFAQAPALASQGKSRRTELPVVSRLQSRCI